MAVVTERKVGTSVRKIDGVEKVTGQAKSMRDLSVKRIHGSETDKCKRLNLLGQFGGL